MTGTLITFGIVIWFFSLAALAAHGRVNTVNENAYKLTQSINIRFKLVEDAVLKILALNNVLADQTRKQAEMIASLQATMDDRVKFAVAEMMQEKIN
jgi:hypothetical protein